MQDIVAWIVGSALGAVVGWVIGVLLIIGMVFCIVKGAGLAGIIIFGVIPLGLVLMTCGAVGLRALLGIFFK